MAWQCWRRKGQILQNDGYFDKSKSIKRISGEKAALPVHREFVNLFHCNCDSIEGFNVQSGSHSDTCDVHKSLNKDTCTYKDFHFVFSDTNVCKNKKIPTLPRDSLRENVWQLIRQHNENDTVTKDWEKCFESELPRSWEKHGDLVMVSSEFFKDDLWHRLGTELWFTVAKSLNVKKVARKSVISRDGHRTPKVELLYGEDGWVEHKDNNVRYMYDVTKCMFSSGNITEKLRVANFNCTGETIVDLYAGIGYFTLPYLVHTEADYVHACEWNPDAVAALKKNLEINGVADRCTVYEGDNRQVCPWGVADRVNLGLIPSSEAGWPIACRAMNPHSGGIMHIHTNVTSASGMGTEPDGVMSAHGKNNPVHQENVKTADPDVEKIRKTGIQDNKSSEDCGQTTLGKSRISDHNCTKGEACSAKDLENVVSCDATTSSDEPSHTAYCDCSNVNDDASCDVLSGPSLCSNSVETDQDNMNKIPNFLKKNKLKKEWIDWADATSVKIKDLLIEVHKTNWTTEVIHIEQVKSYAPHVDHLVLDLMCRPVNVRP